MLFNTCSSLQKHNTCSIYSALVVLIEKLRASAVRKTSRLRTVVTYDQSQRDGSNKI